ncbi:MAG: RNA methyltransferase [Elusimicrobiota bacterium]|jgi:tRNA/rRNA methyltransferase|nr:RNA methyltransferase [Elusimicrobiota bacterium]
MNVAIVLVKPRNPQNIGAAARAMANFGLSDLRVVAPYKPVWEEVLSAPGAEDILKNAKIFDTLQAALADAHFVLATTALKNRRLRQKIVYLDNLNQELAARAGENIALIFGQEKRGLTNGEIALANAVLNIPANVKTPSINLAQAVILCCWELGKTQAPRLKKYQLPKKPTFKELEVVDAALKHLAAVMDLPLPLKTKVKQGRIKEALNNAGLNKEDLFFINAVAQRLAAKLKK